MSRNGTSRLRQDMRAQIQGFRHSYRAVDHSRQRWTNRGTAGSGDLHLDKNTRQDLRNQSRDMDRNNSVFEGILNRGVDNVISTGFTFQMRTPDEVLNKEIEAAFNEWGKTKADFTQSMTFWEMQRLAYRSMLTDGDVGFVKIDDGSLQFIESDLIESTDYRDNGVIRDSFGRVTGYSVSEWNKWGSVDSSDPTPVSAEDFLFLPNIKRFSQTRGVPALASSLELFERLDDYIEATIVAAQVGACQALFIKTEMGAALGAALTDSDETASDGDEQNVEEMEPGRIIYGKPGESAEQIKPEQPAAQFAPFITQLLRFVGLSLGMPLELIALDFSKTNYSSARAALLQAYKSFRVWQKLMKDRFFDPVANWKLTSILQELGVPDVKGARQFTWIAPSWAWVDPLKEEQAHEKAAAAGLETMQKIAADQGQDFKETMDQRGREIKLAMTIAEEIGGGSTWRDIIPSNAPSVGVGIGVEAPKPDEDVEEE